jgi:aspartyl-tRNA(Asn)/glutamyl-tRNA(Gln) amidotransferase subunit C
MALTREQVRHVAELAKLKLTEAEVDLFQEQLSAILDYAARLDELETEQIPPTAAVLPLQNVMRSDTPRASYRTPRMGLSGSRSSWTTTRVVNVRYPPCLIASENP